MTDLPRTIDREAREAFKEGLEQVAIKLPRERRLTQSPNSSAYRQMR